MRTTARSPDVWPWVFLSVTRIFADSLLKDPGIVRKSTMRRNLRKVMPERKMTNTRSLRSRSVRIQTYGHQIHHHSKSNHLEPIFYWPSAWILGEPLLGSYMLEPMIDQWLTVCQLNCLKVPWDYAPVIVDGYWVWASMSLMKTRLWVPSDQPNLWWDLVWTAAGRSLANVFELMGKSLDKLIVTRILWAKACVPFH